MTIRAVLFDLDGTLVRGGPPVRDALAEACALLTGSGCGEVTPASLGAALEAAIPPYRPGATIAVEPFGAGLARALDTLDARAGAGVVEACAATMGAALYSGGRLYDDARAVLASLRYRGYRMAVVTNTNFTGRVVETELARLGAAGYVDAVVSSADVGAGKPDPRPYLAALRALALEAREALFVGDRVETDIAGALAAGMPAVLLDRDGTAPLAPEGVLRIERLTGLNSLLGEGALPPPSGAGAIL